MMMGMFLVAGSALIRARHLIPVHARHHDVEQNEVGSIPGHHRERLFAAGNALEEEAFRREHHFQYLSIVALVVHESRRVAG